MKGSSNRIQHIVGGDATEPNEYPWQVALVGSNPDFVFCGGTIINKKFVMTAAHCTQGSSASSINVKVGEHDLTTSNDNAKVYKVKEIYNHPNYDKQRYVTEIKNHTILMLNLITIVLSFLPSAEPYGQHVVRGIKNFFGGRGSSTILQYWGRHFGYRGSADPLYPKRWG